MPDVHRVLEGTDVAMTCYADGAPTPSAKWSHPSSTSSDVTSQATMTLEAVTAGQADFYYCTTETSAGAASAWVDLRVYTAACLPAPPGPPGSQPAPRPPSCPPSPPAPHRPSCPPPSPPGYPRPLHCRGPSLPAPHQPSCPPPGPPGSRRPLHCRGPSPPAPLSSPYCRPGPPGEPPICTPGPFTST